MACTLAWPHGTLESKPGFKTRKAAENYGRDQEAAIRNHTYVDPRAGQLSLTDWVNRWYPALDSGAHYLSNYRYQIEVNILPEFGHGPLVSLTPEEIAEWEVRLTTESGYARRTAHDARSTLATILNEAVRVIHRFDLLRVIYVSGRRACMKGWPISK